MDTFLDHARQLLDVARADTSGTREDFALVVRPDGGLHFIMETAFSLEAAAAYGGAQSAYRVTRSSTGVRVEGWSTGRTCLVEDRSSNHRVLNEDRLYTITSGDSDGTAGSAVCPAIRRAYPGDLESAMPQSTCPTSSWREDA